MFNKDLINKVINLASDKNNLVINSAGREDIIKHNFKEKLIQEAFLNGMIVEDFELYYEHPDLKHKGKNYYCLHKYKEGFFSVRGLLISFIIENEVIVFHVSPMNYGSREERFYKEHIKQFKELFHSK